MSKLLLFVVLLGTTHSSPLEADPCTVSTYSAIAAAAKSCNTLTLKDIVIPAKTTLFIELKDGAKLIFDGHVTHKIAEWTGDLIRITGKNVQISGTANHLLDGLGPKHWKGANEQKILRPKFLRLQLKDSTVKNLKLKNCPCNCVMIQSSNTVISHINIDNYDGYPGVAGAKYAKNTDGFDVGRSTNLRVENSVVVNQDDCVAVNSGNNIIFDNLHCNGSHGLSFSLKDSDVYDVQFLNSKVTNSNNAIHIKTNNAGGSGRLRNILYKNIQFLGIDRYAVSIQQNYPRGDAKANIPITNLTLENVSGKMTGSKSMALQIICAHGGCKDWNFKNVKVNGAKQKNTCQEVPSGIKC
ncbi:unnamed protein product [Ceutorhynchus assimilis]|uniref:endo-polygalacturonase n=1 Tax=Ceutorhynchus assimilis TaxID=467358 RepID=A0A9N9MH07_9CUCU|nr:unnamed protein product [Ceutorhynchus assimilis]